MLSRFAASQTVDLAINQPTARSLQDYLRQSQRIVYTLFNHDQLQVLGEDVYRFEMRPLQFFSLQLRPIVDLAVWTDEAGVLQIQSRDCQLRGLDLLAARFRLDLEGELLAESSHHLTGEARLRVEVQMPPLLRLTPRPMLEAAGNALLKGVLLTIRQQIQRRLVEDYLLWSQESFCSSVLPPQPN